MIPVCIKVYFLSIYLYSEGGTKRSWRGYLLNAPLIV
jgi:hypothetical protein